MYVHAYQSYIWNRIVTERVKRFGVVKPVVGDVVLLSKDEESGEASADVADEGEDGANEEGEEAKETKQSNDWTKTQPPPALPNVKLLSTQEEVDQYTIHDVVMPLPGYDVTFPEDSWLSQMYASMLAEDGLTPSQIGHSNVP